MPKFLFPALLISSLAFLFFSTNAQAQCVGIENCQLVWSDEFNGTQVDQQRWTFQLGDGTEAVSYTHLTLPTNREV